MSSNTPNIAPYDAVEVPREQFPRLWPLPFDEVWQIAQAEGLKMLTRTTECQCPENVALLRRGPEGQTFVLRQNW